jgi:hypothetical protein
MVLGNYPDMSLADVRIEARAKRAMLDKQRDPLLERQAVVEQQRAAIVAQKARGTFRELAEDWYDTEELLKATWDEFDFEGRPDTGPRPASR